MGFLPTLCSYLHAYSLGLSVVHFYHQFTSACVEVEIAVGVRKVRNTSEDASKSTTPPSATEKKSSFATDEWLAQCKTAKKMNVAPVTSQDDELSSARDVAESTGQRWSSTSWRECPPAPPKDRRASANKLEESDANKHFDRSNTAAERSSTKNVLPAAYQRDRRHVPPDSRRSVASKAESSEQRKRRSRSPIAYRERASETNSNKRKKHRSPPSSKSQSFRSQVEQLRQLEAELERQSKRHSASKLSSVDPTKASAEQVPSAYISEMKSSPHRREPPLPVASNSNMHQVPLNAASSSKLVESYSTKHGREQVIDKYHQQIARNIDYTLSQMKPPAE